MTKIELTRFRIKKGKELRAQEWMDFLNKHHQDTVATMAGERMYIETVFKEESSDGYTYFIGILCKEKEEMQSKIRIVILIKNT